MSELPKVKSDHVFDSEEKALVGKLRTQLQEKAEEAKKVKEELKAVGAELELTRIVAHAQELINWCRPRTLGIITVSQVFQGGPDSLRKKRSDAKKAIEFLARSGFLEEVPRKAAGMKGIKGKGYLVGYQPWVTCCDLDVDFMVRCDEKGKYVDRRDPLLEFHVLPATYVDTLSDDYKVEKRLILRGRYGEERFHKEFFQYSGWNGKYKARDLLEGWLKEIRKIKKKR